MTEAYWHIGRRIVEEEQQAKSVPNMETAYQRAFETIV